VRASRQLGSGRLTPEGSPRRLRLSLNEVVGIQASEALERDSRPVAEVEDGAAADHLGILQDRLGVVARAQPQMVRPVLEAGDSVEAALVRLVELQNPRRDARDIHGVLARAA